MFFLLRLLFFLFEEKIKENQRHVRLPGASGHMLALRCRARPGSRRGLQGGVRAHRPARRARGSAGAAGDELQGHSARGSHRHPGPGSEGSGTGRAAAGQRGGHGGERGDTGGTARGAPGQGGPVSPLEAPGEVRRLRARGKRGVTEGAGRGGAGRVSLRAGGGGPLCPGRGPGLQGRTPPALGAAARGSPG